MYAIINDINEARKYALEGNDEMALSTLNESKSKSPVLKALFEDVYQNLKNDRIFEIISCKDSEILFGNFSCSHHPYLGLEYSPITEVRPSLQLEREFEHIRCVVQAKGTEGISNSQVVAIFPENFKGRAALENDPVYYFVNKFASRHFRYTKPFLLRSCLKYFFKDILNLNEGKICELIANWVHIHELSHRKGTMPIPQFLKEKSGRYSAALEELRADLGVIQYCLKEKNLEAKLTAKYVFAERLLAYPLFRVRTNFDAISSVWFWKYLLERDFFSSPSVESLAESVNALLKDIDNIEKEALALATPVERRAFINKKIEIYLNNINGQFDEYHRFWESV